MKYHFHIALLLSAIFLSLNVSAQKKKKSLSYKDKQKFERLYIDASRAKILADYEQAIKLYETCKKIDPSQPAVHYELGNLYIQFAQYEDAVENAEFAAKADPENVYYRIMYAEVLKGAHYYDRAIKEYEGIISDFPDRFEIYAELALLEIVQRDFDKAIDVYDRLEQNIGPTEEIKLKKQYLYLQSGNVDKAASEIEELINLQPNNVKYYLLLAEVYYVNGFEDKALKAYKNAEEKFPANPEIQLSLAEFYQHKKQYKKVFDHMEIAFRSEDLDIDSKVKSILELFDLVNVERQYRDDLQKLGLVLLEVHPKDARVLTINGDLAMNMNEPEKARDYFEEAIQLDKSRFPIWNQLLILDAELSDHEALKKHATEASELFPNQPLCFYFLGYANGRLDETQEAIEAYEAGVKVTIDNDLLLIQFYLGLGESYNTVANYHASDEAFEKVLKLDSNNTIALNNYSYYLSLREENLERALELSGRSNKLEPNSATYLDTYAWILYKLQRYEEAKKFMKQAIDNGGGNSTEILEHMGDIHYQLGDSDLALRYWKQAKEKGEGSDFLEQKISEGKLYE